MTKSTLAIATLALLATNSDILAQGRDDGRRDDGQEKMDRWFSYMDRNRDGHLDGEEMRRIPGPMRENLQRARVDLSRGMSKSDFMQHIPKAYEEMRRRQDDDRRRYEEDRRRKEEQERYDREKYEAKKREKEEKKARKTAYTPTKRERVTIDMPSKYADGDNNGDDQLTIAEWRAWKGRQALREFMRLDQNGDGFLTPREMANPPKDTELVFANSSKKTSPSAAKPAPPTTQRVFVTGAKTSTNMVVIGSKDGTAFAVATSNPVIEREANSAFGLIDRYGNKDGKINPSEWRISKVIKPAFEKAGVDMKKDMNNAEFIQVYLKVFPNGRPQRR